MYVYTHSINHQELPLLLSFFNQSLYKEYNTKLGGNLVTNTLNTLYTLYTHTHTHTHTHSTDIHTHSTDIHTYIYYIHTHTHTHTHTHLLSYLAVLTGYKSSTKLVQHSCYSML